MPGNVSVDPRYTAHTQYRQFVDFAQGVKEKADTIAESRGSLIVGAKSTPDFIGNIFRTSSSKASNDEVRNRFKSAIMGMFCVTDESALPDSVKNAMKLDDYGKGKPLTARRILAVQTTVDKYFADKAQVLMDEATKQGVESNEMSRKLIRAAVTACVEDPDAMEVVKANIKDVLVDFTLSSGTNVLRPVHGVKEKVDAVMSNFRALRAFAKDDADLFTVAKSYVDLGAKDFNVLMSAVTEGRQQLQPHLDQLLKHSHGARDMDEGVRAFSKALDETMSKCVAVVGQPAGPSEAAHLQTFVVRALLHRDGDARSVYHDLDVAVKSDAAKQLKALYRDLLSDLQPASEGKGAFGDLSGGLRRYMADHAERGSKCLDLLNDSMYDVYEVPANERRAVGPLQGDTRPSNDFGTIGQSLKAAGLESMRTDRDAFLQDAVKGSGVAADRMRSVFARKVDEAGLYRPADTLKSQCEETIRGIFNQKFVSDLRTFQNPNMGMAKFGPNMHTFSVELPSGKSLARISFFARDELADFVTGGRKTAFKDLTLIEQKKVYAIMAFVLENIPDESYNGLKRALDPEYDPRKGPLEEAKHKFQFGFYDDSRNSSKPKVTLALGDDGGLEIGFFDSRFISQFETRDDDGRMVSMSVEGKADIDSFTQSDILLGRPLGSRIDVKYSIHVNGDAFARLANSDLGQAQLDESDVTCSDFQMTFELHDPLS